VNAKLSEQPSDQNFEIFLGHLLRTGVLIAAAVALLGAIWFLSHGTSARKDYATFRGEPAELSQVGQIVHAALEAQPLAIIQLGMLILIATPVARVLFSMLGFALERDWMYVAVTLIVLALLIYSLASKTTQ
jgi:uncharacterized membrane protein